MSWSPTGNKIPIISIKKCLYYKKAPVRSDLKYYEAYDLSGPTTIIGSVISLWTLMSVIFPTNAYIFIN